MEYALVRNVLANHRINLGQDGPRRVRVVFYDDQSLASVARENALRLLRQDRVDALFGPYSSGLAMTVAEVAHEHGSVVWNQGGSVVRRRGKVHSE